MSSLQRHRPAGRVVNSAMTTASRLELLRRPWPAVVIAMLGLGATVAASWLLFGGSIAFRGPLSALRESWPLIYGSQALMAAVGTFAYERLAGPSEPSRLLGIVAAAWLGEWAVLFFGGTLFAGELVPSVAWFYWLVGTGGPVQPLAALAGGWLARTR